MENDSFRGHRMPPCRDVHTCNQLGSTFSWALQFGDLATTHEIDFFWQTHGGVWPPARAHTTNHIFAPVNCNGQPHAELRMTTLVHRPHCTQIQMIDHGGHRHRWLARASLGASLLLLAPGTLVRRVTYRLVFGVPIRSCLSFHTDPQTLAGLMHSRDSDAQSHQSTILPAPTILSYYTLVGELKCQGEEREKPAQSDPRG